ncbi:hypothetical protein MAR_015073 [Mya arenaria]|uniref:Uncharacterized protein n=1 Tax=Mya arenaria TaxID=6604 RepID=A0ABY7FIW5_MYAAR|nr:hypothetical protein MAR_015073 [Mya arenaria]
MVQNLVHGHKYYLHAMQGHKYYLHAIQVHKYYLQAIQGHKYYLHAMQGHKYYLHAIHVHKYYLHAMQRHKYYLHAIHVHKYYLQAIQGHKYYLQAIQGHKYCLQAIQGHKNYLQAIQGHIYYLQAIQGHKYYLQAIQGHKYYLHAMQGHKYYLQAIHVHKYHLQAIQGHKYYLQAIQGHKYHLQAIQGHNNYLQSIQGHKYYLQAIQGHKYYLQVIQGHKCYLHAMQGHKYYLHAIHVHKYHLQAIQGHKYYLQAIQGHKYYLQAIQGHKYYLQAIQGHKYHLQAIQGHKYHLQAIQGHKYYMQAVITELCELWGLLGMDSEKAALPAGGMFVTLESPSSSDVSASLGRELSINCVKYVPESARRFTDLTDATFGDGITLGHLHGLDGLCILLYKATLLLVQPHTAHELIMLLGKEPGWGYGQRRVLLLPEVLQLGLGERARTPRRPGAAVVQTAGGGPGLQGPAGEALEASDLIVKPPGVGSLQGLTLGTLLMESQESVTGAPDHWKVAWKSCLHLMVEKLELELADVMQDMKTCENYAYWNHYVSRSRPGDGLPRSIRVGPLCPDQRVLYQKELEDIVHTNPLTA